MSAKKKPKKRPNTSASKARPAAKNQQVRVTHDPEPVGEAAIDTAPQITPSAAAEKAAVPSEATSSSETPSASVSSEQVAAEPVSSTSAFPKPPAKESPSKKPEAKKPGTKKPVLKEPATVAPVSQKSAPQTSVTVASEPVEQPTVPAAPRTSDEASQTPRWQKFAFGGSRSITGSVAAAALALGLGFAVMTQVRQNEKSGLDDLSQSELVALLANVNDQSARLEDELSDLRATKAQLAQGGDKAAVADAQKRLDELQILNGAVAVKGPGITIAVNGADKGVTSANVIDAVQELRDAGAESIDIAGHRVVASTWFADVGGHAGLGGSALPANFTITAIGDPHTMSTAMAIPGGVTDTLTQAGAQVKVAEGDSMRITSIAPHS